MMFHVVLLRSIYHHAGQSRLQWGAYPIQEMPTTFSLLGNGIATQSRITVGKSTDSGGRLFGFKTHIYYPFLGEFLDKALKFSASILLSLSGDKTYRLDRRIKYVNTTCRLLIY